MTARPVLFDLDDDDEAASSDDFTARRVVLLGKTGSGKSTLGNLLLKKDDALPDEDDEEGEGQVKGISLLGNLRADGFVVATGFDPETNHCMYKDAYSWGVFMQVVDTPGLFSPTDDLQETLNKVTVSVSLSLPGPHAILYVIRSDVMFTEEEAVTFDKIIEVFGEEVRDHVIVVFTRGDALGKRSIDKLVAKAPPALRRVLDAVDNRWVVVGLTQDERQKTAQMVKLLDMMNDVTQQGAFSFGNLDIDRLNIVMDKEVTKVMKKDNLTRSQALSLLKKALTSESAEVTALRHRLRLVMACSQTMRSVLGLPESKVAEKTPASQAVEALLTSTDDAESGDAAPDVSALSKMVTSALSDVQRHLTSSPPKDECLCVIS